MDRQAQEAREVVKDEKGEMRLQRLVIDARSPFLGKNIQESGIRQEYHCMVVGLEQEGSASLVAPDTLTPFAVGDVLWVVGEEENLKQFIKPNV